MSHPLTLSGIHCGYGETRVLDDVNLTLPKGSITGLLGRNGSGKTTLMRVALGLIPADAGEALLFGAEAWDSPSGVRERLGFVSQNFNHFPGLDARACLELVGSLYTRWDHGYLAHLIQAWGVSRQPIQAMSPGEKQKVAILMALGHRPELLVLDEPVASLDPGSRRDFFSFLVELNADTDQTILLSSHITSDLERVCSHVAMLKDGRMISYSALDELKEQTQQPLEDLFIELTQ